MGLVKINAKDFGLEESKATTIESSFIPVITERDIISEIYKDLISSEITEELCERAGLLSTKLSKVNASLIRVHKAEKSFYLAGGKFVDAIKNKNIVVIEEMQTRLKALKNHFKNIEAERVEKLNQERKILCIPFVDSEEMILSNLGSLSDNLWENYFTGLKVSYKAAKDAERKAEEAAIEAERIDKLRANREIQLRPYYQFIPKSHPDFALLSDDEWNDFFAEMNNAKCAYNKEQAKIKEENERLKEAAKERERELEKERAEAARLAKIEADKQDKILNQQKKAADRKLAEIKANADKLAAELKEKEDAEKEAELFAAKLIADEKEAARLATLAPENDKISAWIYSFNINDIDTSEFSATGVAVVNAITQKFKGFKKWAENQK